MLNGGSIYQDRIYSIDYERNTFEILEEVKKPLRSITMGQYTPPKEKLDCGETLGDAYFEVKIRD